MSYYVKYNATGNEPGCMFTGDWAISLSRPSDISGFKAVPRNILTQTWGQPIEVYIVLVPAPGTPDGFIFYKFGGNVSQYNDYESSNIYDVFEEVKKLILSNGLTDVNTINNISHQDLIELMLQLDWVILANGIQDNNGPFSNDGTKRYYLKNNSPFMMVNTEQDMLINNVVAHEEPMLLIFSDPNKFITDQYSAVLDFARHKASIDFGGYGTFLSDEGALSEIALQHGVTSINITLEYNTQINAIRKKKADLVFWNALCRLMLDYDKTWYLSAKTQFELLTASIGGKVVLKNGQTRYVAVPPITGSANSSDDTVIKWGDNTVSNGGINYINPKQKYTHYYPHSGPWVVAVSGSSINVFGREDIKTEVNYQTLPNVTPGFRIEESSGSAVIINNIDVDLPYTNDNTYGFALVGLNTKYTSNFNFRIAGTTTFYFSTYSPNFWNNVNSIHFAANSSFDMYSFIGGLQWSLQFVNETFLKNGVTYYDGNAFLEHGDWDSVEDLLINTYNWNITRVITELQFAT